RPVGDRAPLLGRPGHGGDDVVPVLATDGVNAALSFRRTHFIASLAGASLASGGVSSAPGHRNGAWGCVVPEARRLAPCGVRPGACGAHAHPGTAGRRLMNTTSGLPVAG